MYPCFSWQCYMHLLCVCVAHTFTGFVTEFTVYITGINGTWNCKHRNVSGLLLRSLNLANL